MHKRHTLTVPALLCAGWPVATPALDTNVAMPVEVVTREELADAGQSITDVLQSMPRPADVPRDAGAGPWIRGAQRGLHGPSTLLLIDGQRVPADALTTIPLSAINRVEILRDGMSALYGSDAVRSAVNVITSRDSGLDDINLAADWLTDCDATAGVARPLWTYTGGMPFGGSLLTDRTWFLPPSATGTPAPGAGFFALPPRVSAGGWRPMVSIDPAPDATARLALGPSSAPAPEPAPVSVFPAEAFRGGVPPESTVMRSAACAAALKDALKPLYQARDQALADWVAFSDAAGRRYRAPQDRAADQAQADAARARRDEANAAIRKLLDGCTEPAAGAPGPATTAAAPGGAAGAVGGGSAQLTLEAVTPKDPANPGLGLKSVPGAAFTLTPKLDLALPWGDAKKDADLWSSYGSNRAWTGTDGKVTLSINPDLGTAFQWGKDPLLARLDQVDSTVVELRGERQNVRFGSGNGERVDPLERFEMVDGKFPVTVEPYVSDAFNIGNKTYLVFNYPQGLLNDGHFDRIRGAARHYPDYCGDVALPANPDDPAWRSSTTGGGKGSWGQPFDDQWALKRIGLTAGEDSAWTAIPDGSKPVIVGIIDTGLDWHHADLDWQNLWRNTREIPGNRRDDDNNGYIDDVIGWNFTNDDNYPWDYDGHGTFVTGIVAARRNNGTGISGIDPNVRIMVLKAVNGFGRTRASYLAKAIAYGVDNGASILNISVAGKGLPPVVEDAIAYAEAKGVLVIVAAGNSNEDIAGIQPAGAAGALVVAATDLDDQRAGFSNFGAGIGVAAPGVEIMSLRARLTDFMWNDPADRSYRPGQNFVGADRRYYHSTGTSFAAPIVTGLASLVWSKDPSLAATDVRRIIEQSARDVDTPGRDRFTGYGLVDARAALAADPRFFIATRLDRVEPVQQGRQTVLAVQGTADADQFARAWLELGQGEAPAGFKRVGKELKAPVVDGTVGEIPVQELTGAKTWTLRLVTEHRNGRTREVRFVLNLG